MTYHKYIALLGFKSNACINGAQLGRLVEAHRVGTNLMQLLEIATHAIPEKPKSPSALPRFQKEKTH